MERKQQKILGFNVDLFSYKKALNYLENKMDNSIGAHVVTINPEMIELGNKNQEFANMLNNADFIIPDGIGIRIALKMNGIEQEQIPGVEFAKDMIKICANKQYPIALIGAKEEILIKTKEKLLKEYPGLIISYSRNGYFNEEQEQGIISELAEKQPKLILLALGAPKQDFFTSKCKQQLPHSTFIGVGGSFDVWSGEVKRAPMFYRKIGCEWLYRVLKQPSRFKRIFPTLPLFLIKVIIEKIKK